MTIAPSLQNRHTLIDYFKNRCTQHVYVDMFTGKLKLSTDMFLDRECPSKVRIFNAGSVPSLPYLAAGKRGWLRPVNNHDNVIHQSVSLYLERLVRMDVQKDLFNVLKKEVENAILGNALGWPCMGPYGGMVWWERPTLKSLLQFSDHGSVWYEPYKYEYSNSERYIGKFVRSRNPVLIWASDSGLFHQVRKLDVRPYDSDLRAGMAFKLKGNYYSWADVDVALSLHSNQPTLPIEAAKIVVLDAAGAAGQVYGMDSERVVPIFKRALNGLGHFARDK